MGLDTRLSTLERKLRRGNVSILKALNELRLLRKEVEDYLNDSPISTFNAPKTLKLITENKNNDPTN